MTLASLIEKLEAAMRASRYRNQKADIVVGDIRRLLRTIEASCGPLVKDYKSPSPNTFMGIPVVVNRNLLPGHVVLRVDGSVTHVINLDAALPTPLQEGEDG